jgi:hypothetical protein
MPSALRHLIAEVGAGQVVIGMPSAASPGARG